MAVLGLALCLALPPGLHAQQPSAGPASSGAAPAEGATAAGALPDLRPIEAAWQQVLEMGRRKGGEAEKRELERMAASAQSPFVAALASVFVEEWNFKAGDMRIDSPRKVWSPPLPTLGPNRAASPRIRRKVGGSADISPDGRVLAVRIEEKTGDDELDFLVERWIRESRFRPAQNGTRWVKGKASWGVELH
jgi:hypothetical protein